MKKLVCLVTILVAIMVATPVVARDYTLVEVPVVQVDSSNIIVEGDLPLPMQYLADKAAASSLRTGRFFLAVTGADFVGVSGVQDRIENSGMYGEASREIAKSGKMIGPSMMFSMTALTSYNEEERDYGYQSGGNSWGNGYSLNLNGGGYVVGNPADRSGDGNGGQRIFGNPRDRSGNGNGGQVIVGNPADKTGDGRNGQVIVGNPKDRTGNGRNGQVIVGNPKDRTGGPGNRYDDCNGRNRWYDRGRRNGSGISVKYASGTIEVALVLKPVKVRSGLVSRLYEGTGKAKSKSLSLGGNAGTTDVWFDQSRSASTSKVKEAIDKAISQVVSEMCQDMSEPKELMTISVNNAKSVEKEGTIIKFYRNDCWISDFEVLGVDGCNLFVRPVVEKSHPISGDQFNICSD